MDEEELKLDDEVVDSDLGNPDDEVSGGEPEDRGDNLPDETLEVDEDVIAELAKDDETTGKDDRTIPKSRFDAVNNERKDLKARLEALEAQVTGTAKPAAPAEPEKPAFDVDAAETEYANALVEGDLEKAKAIRKEIRTFEQAQLKEELRKEAAQAKTAEDSESRKQAVIAQAYTDHPQLNHESESYDPALVAKINRMNAAYLAEGKPADEALALAIEDFAPKREANKEGEKGATDKGEQAAKARNAKAAAAQPPGLGGVGTGERAAAAALSIETMTDEEFNALPEREKKRLRGD